MEMAQLRVFLAVAKHRSFTAASRQLHLSQPAVSQSIKLLEDYCENKLFVRTAKEIRLTSNGEALMPYAQRIINLAAEAYQAAQEARGNTTLRIGIVRSYFDRLGPLIVNEFRLICPEGLLCLHADNTQQLQRELITENHDMVFTCRGIDSPEFAFLPIIEERVLLMQSATAPLLPSSITIAQMNDVPFINYSKVIGYHRMISERLRRYDCKPRVIAELNSVAAIRSLVEKGLGVGFLPNPPGSGAESGLPEEAGTSPLEPIEITDTAPLVHRIGLTYRRNGLSRTAKRFLSLIEGSLLQLTTTDGAGLVSKTGSC